MRRTSYERFSRGSRVTVSVAAITIILVYGVSAVLKGRLWPLSTRNLSYSVFMFLIVVNDFKYFY